MTSVTEMLAAKKQESKVRVFHGEFLEFHNLITPTGEVVSFYKGFLKTDRDDIIEFLKTVKSVTEVTSKVKAEEIPDVPARNRQRVWHAAANPGVITPAELLQRAVASTAAHPQSAQSTSTSK